MLIAISGTLSAGKTEVARYLTFQGFQPVAVGEHAENGVAESGEKSLESEPSQGEPIESQGRSPGTATPGSEGTDTVLYPTLAALVDATTANWRAHHVITHLELLEMLQVLQKRPFFLHVSVDAPTRVRFERHNGKRQAQGVAALSFAEFVDALDRLLYRAADPLVEINNQAHVKIVNTLRCVKSLYVRLLELDLLSGERLRPSWDLYFMRLADLAALRSNCMKRRVGCVIVKENRVVATGYNGTPRRLANCNEGGCPRCNAGEGLGAALLTCLCLHAEENALLEAGRDRISGDGSILYCNTCPCLTCLIKIVQSGIREVVYAQSYSMDEHLRRVFAEASVLLRQYVPPQEGVFI